MSSGDKKGLGDRSWGLVFWDFKGKKGHFHEGEQANVW